MISTHLLASFTKKSEDKSATGTDPTRSSGDESLQKLKVYLPRNERITTGLFYLDTLEL